MGERDIRRVLGKSRRHQQLNVRFQNKAILKPIRARSVQIRHQADLISMESMPATWKGKTFKFVLSLMDVFSRYHWLIPLEGKSSKPIAVALSELYIQHGPPRVIQHDMTKAQSLKVPLRSFARNQESKLSKDAHITHSHRVRSNEHTVHLEKS